MFDLIIGLMFIIFGMKFIYLAFKLKRTKDINLIKNNMVKIEKIKDKEGYFNFNFKINLMMGIVELIYGVVAIINKYNKNFENIHSIMGTVMLVSMFIFFYYIIFKAPKFQK